MKYIKAADGIGLATYILNKDADKAIILVHGWPLNHTMWEYQLPALLNDGYCVVTYDIRGFGDSDVSGDRYDYDTFADDLHSVASHLVEHVRKFDKFDLIGFSMGGAICARYMNKHNGHWVNKLCFVDAAIPSYCQTDNNPYGQEVIKTNYLLSIGIDDRPELNEMFGDMFFSSDISAAYADYIFDMSNKASGIGEIKSFVALRDEDCYNDLKTIKTETAIFHGLDDVICKYEMAEIVHDLIDNSKLYSYDNAGHGMFFESKYDFNRDLIDFLNS